MLHSLQPPGNAHALAAGYGHFMLQLVALEEYGFLVVGEYLLCIIIVVDDELAAIAVDPVVIEIAYHRIFPVIVVLKLVAVPDVTGAFLIEGIMEFTCIDAGEAGLVEVFCKLPDHIEEFHLAFILRLLLYPAGFITPYFLAFIFSAVVAHPCAFHAAIPVQPVYILQQGRSQRKAQKRLRYTHLIRNKPLYQFLKFRFHSAQGNLYTAQT